MAIFCWFHLTKLVFFFALYGKFDRRSEFENSISYQSIIDGLKQKYNVIISTFATYRNV